MRYVVSGEQMKRADAYTIHTIGIPSPVLMERAAMAVADRLKCGCFDLRKVLVVCGTGNNGGDGLAVARLLYLSGIDVSVLMAGDINKGSAEAQLQYNIASFYGIPEVCDIPQNSYTVIVDAIFGVGLSREVTGEYAELIEKINQSNARIMAVDISSGIHSDNGKVMGIAVQAHETVTFAFEKAGHLLYPGAEYTGMLSVADIGITKEAFAGDFPNLCVLEQEDIDSLAPRTDRSNKGTYGKVLVVAGSKGMAGAAYLSAAGAYRSGCGLVKIYTEDCNREILQKLLPEAMTDTYTRGVIEDSLKEHISWADAVVFGPGVGTDEFAQELLKFILKNCEKPLILDADGITMISGCPDLWKKHPANCIFTPHPGEMARLLGCNIKDVTEDIYESSLACAKKYQAVSVLKDAHTVISIPDGRAVINLTGNHGMATGGSGDVLTGIIASFAARGVDIFEAAAAGVFVHGTAGDKAAKELGAGRMLSGDIVNYI